jgi:hypothetical protein
VAPVSTPSGIVERLAAILTAARNDTVFRATLEEDGSEVVFDGPSEFAALLPYDAPRWKSLINESA